MSKYRVSEFDDYEYPQPLSVETPETRAKLNEIYEETKAIAERHHREAEATERAK